MTLGEDPTDDVPPLAERRSTLPPRLVGVPRLSRAHLSRPRLLRLLDDEESTPLRVVRAPAGYGKTSLVAEWVRTGHRGRGGPVLWVTVDEECGTRLSFWSVVIGLLDAAGLVGATGFRGVQARGDLAPTLSTALLHGFESLPEPVTLVIDSYERLHDEAVETDLIRLVRHTENLRLVVSTRTGSPISSLTTALTVDTVLIDAGTLQLRPEETAGLAGHLGSTLNEKQLEALHHASSGWPLAVRAALQSPSSPPLGGGSPGLGSASASIVHLQHRLIGDVSGLRGFSYLVTTSLVDAFTTGQAVALGADPDEVGILDHLESRGLGYWEGEHEPFRFRLQPLLRQALQERLTGKERLEVARRLARWFEDLGDYPRAFHAAVEARDWGLVRRYVRRDYPRIADMINEDPAVMAAVPSSVILAEPLIGFVSGVAQYAAGNTRKAILTLTAAIGATERQRLAHHSTITVDQVWIQAVLTAGLRLAGRYELVGVALDRFHRMLSRLDDPAGELRYAAEMFQVETGTTYAYLDRFDDAGRTLAEPVVPYVRALSPHFYGPSLASFVAAEQGEIARAREALSDLNPAVLPAQFRDSFYAIPMHLAVAQLLLEDHRPEDAEAELALSDPHWPTMEGWPFVLRARATAHWHSSGPARALRTLQDGIAEKKGRPSIGPAMTAMLVALHADLLVAGDRIGEGRELLRSRKHRSYPRLAVSRARVLLMGGYLDEAVALADRELESLRATPRDRLHMLVIGASARLRSGDVAGASQHAVRATELALSTGQRTPFAAMPRRDFRVLADLVPALDALRDDVERFPELFPEPDSLVRLTPRELVVLAELGTSAAIPAIARKLSVSANTVKTQRRAIYHKLGVSQRADAVAEAKRRGIL